MQIHRNELSLIKLFGRQCSKPQTLSANQTLRIIMTKTSIIIFLFLLNNCFSQTIDKIVLSKPKGDKYFVYKYKDYNVLFSYSSFIETFKPGGVNSADTIFAEYKVMSKLLNDYFKNNDRLNPSKYIDRTSKRFLDTLLAKYTDNCIKKAIIDIEHDQTKKMETFIFHTIDKKENPKEHESRITEKYLISDKKTSLIWLEKSHIHN